MALAGSGAISFANIRDEFSPGSNTSVSLSDYYRQGSKIRAKAGDNNGTHLASGVPTSGALSLSDYHGTGIGFQFTISSDATNQNLSTIFGDDYDLDYPKFVVINSGVTVGGTSTSTPAINVPSGGAGTITITNGGNIYGKGGAAGAVGGDAIVAATACNVVNNGNIKSGGGGGGNGGAGGDGTASVNSALNNFTDVGGSQSGSNVPQNNAPSWFTAYGGDNDLNGQGSVANRKWRGINGNSPQSGGIGQSGQFQVNTSSTEFSANCANRGPLYFSFQLGTTGTYTVSGSINNGTYGSGYGSVVINISTSTSSKSQGQGGGDYTPGQTVNMNADTTYYYCANLTTSGNRDLYYNTFAAGFSLTTNSVTSGGSAGAGGAGASYNASAGSGGAGGSGGTNAGDGGAGGNGGALGAAGSNGTAGGNGSGTGITFPSTAPVNGSSGSSGGAAGKYINGQSNVTLTNNGTVAGNIA
jgi:hypothetical protein